MRSMLALLLSTTAATADAPRVVTDIAPVHSLVSQVMEGVGSPSLLLPQDASPHHWSMRPSDATTLSKADIVIWVGEGLTPWLEEPLETLAPNAVTLEFLHSDGWEKREFEDGHEDEHDEHAHDDEHKHDEHAHEDEHKHDEHAHEDEHKHDEHAHEDEHKHDEHAHEDEHKHDEHAHDHHDHGPIDPHAWMSPEVAADWLGLIAGTLSAADPANAGTYAANAQSAAERLRALGADVRGDLAGRSGTFVVPHDAYGYFTDFAKLGDGLVIADSHATAPGAAHIAALYTHMAAEHVTCVFADAQTSPKWAKMLTDGTDIKTVDIDPIGHSLTAGAELYPALIRKMAASFAACLDG